jgi:Domain of unknown function (DUF222)
MSAWPAADEADEPLLRACDAVREVLARPGFAWSDGEVREQLRQLHALGSVVHAAKLAFIHTLDSRPDAVAGAPAGKVAVTFLTQALHESGPKANREAAAARALMSPDAELPLLAEALMAGEVSPEHVDSAVATLARIPKKLKTKQLDPEPMPDCTERLDTGVRSGADVIDEFLTGWSRHLPPTSVDRLGRQIMARLDPDRAERFDADAYQRRGLSIGTDFAGMGSTKWRPTRPPTSNSTP